VTQDDSSIDDATDLFRRIHPEQVVWDDNESRLRPTSAAFRDAEMSVHLSDVLAERGLLSITVLDDRPQHQLAAITAGFSRSEEQAVARTPTDEDPAHGDVIGPKSRTRRNRFAKGCRWEVLRRETLQEELRLRLEAEGSGA
jgi:hypothetical protein